MLSKSSSQLWVFLVDNIIQQKNSKIQMKETTKLGLTKDVLLRLKTKREPVMDVCI